MRSDGLSVTRSSREGAGLRVRCVPSRCRCGPRWGRWACQTAPRRGPGRGPRAALAPPRTRDDALPGGVVRLDGELDQERGRAELVLEVRGGERIGAVTGPAAATPGRASSTAAGTGGGEGHRTASESRVKGWCGRTRRTSRVGRRWARPPRGGAARRETVDSGETRSWGNQVESDPGGQEPAWGACTFARHRVWLEPEAGRAASGRNGARCPSVPRHPRSQVFRPRHELGGEGPRLRDALVTLS